MPATPRTMVLQSPPPHPPPWVVRCLDSVRQWAEMQSHEYRCIGDELFADVPAWYLDKIPNRMAVAADLGRLQWAQRLLDANKADWIIWLDADVLLFAPHLLELGPREHCMFGLEHWIQAESASNSSAAAKWRVHHNTHNALACFPRHCPVLPFLQHAILRLMRRVDPERIAPQMMGPKLLGSLHSLVDFERTSAVGALSPLVLKELHHLFQAADAPLSTGALAAAIGAQREPMAGANLCATLVADQDNVSHEQMLTIVNQLLALGSLPDWVDKTV